MELNQILMSNVIETECSKTTWIEVYGGMPQIYSKLLYGKALW
jgi:hypothetical protein